MQRVRRGWRIDQPWQLGDLCDTLSDVGSHGVYRTDHYWLSVHHCAAGHVISEGLETKEIKTAFDMAEEYFKKEKSLAEMKSVSKEVITIARQQDLTPAAQAAARAISAAFSSFSTPTSALGMVFYAAAAVAYDREGTEQTPQRYEEIAEQEAKNLYQRLQEIAVKGEKKPAKLNWNC